MPSLLYKGEREGKRTYVGTDTANYATKRPSIVDYKHWRNLNNEDKSVWIKLWTQAKDATKKTQIDFKNATYIITRNLNEANNWVKFMIWQ